ncbi:hypothetical protein GLAREA_01611 [Glarea lozoyensis ATCC 20868]|uniref:Uncharacterized protein n=1 Tax=Glarea lozoyensis (strain ATCC 20868 / MF5171) TaxID=1116229 RepID=S3CKG3_GLAL2|nr:uncharacterized protein GLAREA_01611 [Glarea lozoyensis ATCC 20868]EPE25699.1 hypothetical protein GLAREA_01611 [Glarea lozoyensis ATCC 20868]
MKTRSTEKRISAEPLAFHPVGVRKQPRVKSTPKSAPRQQPGKAQVSTHVQYGVSDGHHVNTFILPSQPAPNSSGKATNATKPRLILRHKIPESSHLARAVHVNSNRQDGFVANTQQPTILPEDVYYYIGWITNSDPPIRVKASRHGGYLIMRVHSPSGRPGTADHDSPGLKGRIQIKEVTLDPQLFSAYTDSIDNTNMVKKEMIVEHFLRIVSNIQTPSTSTSQTRLAEKRTEPKDPASHEERLQPPTSGHINQAPHRKGLANNTSREKDVTVPAHGHLAVGKYIRETKRTDETVWACLQSWQDPKARTRLTINENCKKVVKGQFISFDPKLPSSSAKAMPLIKAQLRILAEKSGNNPDQNYYIDDGTIDFGPQEVELHVEPQTTKPLSTIAEDLEGLGASLESDSESTLIPATTANPAMFSMSNNIQIRGFIGNNIYAAQGSQTGFSVPIQQPAMMAKPYKSIYTDLRAPLQQSAMIVESTQTPQVIQTGFIAPFEQPAIMAETPQDIEMGFQPQIQQPVMVAESTQTDRAVQASFKAPIQRPIMIEESTQTDQAIQMGFGVQIQPIMIGVATQTQPMGNDTDRFWILRLEGENDELRKRNLQLEKENFYLTERLKEATSGL